MRCWPAQVRSFGLSREGLESGGENEQAPSAQNLRLKLVGGVPNREIARRVGVAASTIRGCCIGIERDAVSIAHNPTYPSRGFSASAARADSRCRRRVSVKMHPPRWVVALS